MPRPPLTEKLELKEIFEGGQTWTDWLEAVEEGSEEKIRFKPTEEGQPLLFVFKTVSDPYAGHLSFFKVMRGRLAPDAHLTNLNAGKAERLPLQIFRKTAEGALERVYCGPGPARSEELQAWLVVRSTGGRRVLRVARDHQAQIIAVARREVAVAVEIEEVVFPRTVAGHQMRSQTVERGRHVCIRIGNDIRRDGQEKLRIRCIRLQL